MTALLWLLSLGLYWPVWLWRTYRALHEASGSATRTSPGRAALLAALPVVNLLWTVLLAVDLPRALRRARAAGGDEPPDTESITILLLAPLAAGVALAVLLDLSPVLVVLLAGYLAWPFELPGAIAAERALGPLQAPLAPADRRRHTLVALCAGVVATAVVVVAIASGGEEEQRGPTPVVPRAPAADVSDIAVTKDALWVTDSTHSTVLKLDRRTHRRLAPPIRVGREPIDIGARADGIWAANYRSGTLSRIDPETDRATEAIPTGRGPFGIAVTDDAVWVANQVERTVSRIDPATNEVVGQPVLVGRGPRGVAVGEGSVWVANGEGNSVSRFPLAGNVRRARQIKVGRFSHDVAVAGGSVWATNPSDSAVTRINPDTNRVQGAPVTVPGGPSTIEAGFGLLWVASEAGTVTRIDPRTGELSGGPLEIGSRVADLTVGDDAVWVLLGDGKVRRLRPPR